LHANLLLNDLKKMLLAAWGNMYLRSLPNLIFLLLFVIYTTPQMSLVFIRDANHLCSTYILKTTETLTI